MPLGFKLSHSMERGKVYLSLGTHFCPHPVLLAQPYTPGWLGNHSPEKTAICPGSLAPSLPRLHLLLQSGLSLHHHHPRRPVSGKKRFKGEGGSHPSQRHRVPKPRFRALPGDASGRAWACIAHRETIETSMWDGRGMCRGLPHLQLLKTPGQTPGITLGRQDFGLGKNLSALWGQAPCHRPDSFLRQGELMGMSFCIDVSLIG